MKKKLKKRTLNIGGQYIEVKISGDISVRTDNLRYQTIISDILGIFLQGDTKTDTHQIITPVSAENLNHGDTCQFKSHPVMPRSYDHHQDLTIIHL